MEYCVANPDELVRVLIAGGGSFFRGIVAAVISQARDLEVVASMPGPPKIVPAAQELRPDAVLLGDMAPNGDLVSIIGSIHAELPSCGIVLITETKRIGDLRKAVAAGAVGYPVDEIGPRELIDVLRRAGRGALTADDSLAPTAVGSLRNCPLTEREVEVLRLAAEGASSAEIASRLCLSSRTVRNHVSRIMGKVGARNRIDAIRIAAEAGWI